jgi:PAS domain S-box-containing protein
MENKLSLTDFLHAEKEAILEAWEREERKSDASSAVPRDVLRDSIPKILEEVAEQASQRERCPSAVRFPPSLPRAHAQQRIALQFPLEDVTREYSILRRVILKKIGPWLNRVSAEDVTFLNEVLDEAIVESVKAYTEVSTAKLRESEARYNRIYNSGIIGIIEYDAQGGILNANDTFLELVGYSREDVEQGRLNVFALTPPEFQDATTQAFETLRTTGLLLPVEKQYFRKNGSRVDVVVSSAMLDDLRETGVALVLDISERKRLEAEQKRRSEFEKQLIGIVSHDLRGPLTTISLAASLLQRREDLDGRARGVVTNIVNASERANRLILDLLDFTKARLSGSIPVERQSMDVNDVVLQLVEEMRLSHPRRKIEFAQNTDGEGEWDPDRLAQLMANLVINALTYSPADTPITVRLDGDDSDVVLTVHNVGEAIPSDMLPHLFNPFDRGSQIGSGASRSLGLGLFIVKQLVEAHEGSVSAVSTAEEGTTFTVRLPRHAHSAA